MSSHFKVKCLFNSKKKEEQKTESQHPLEVGIKGHGRTEIDLRERQVLWGGTCVLLGVRTPSPWPDPITGRRIQRYTEKYRETLMVTEQMSQAGAFPPVTSRVLDKVPADSPLSGTRDPVTD